MRETLFALLEDKRSLGGIFYQFDDLHYHIKGVSDGRALFSSILQAKIKGVCKTVNVDSSRFFILYFPGGTPLGTPRGVHRLLATRSAAVRFFSRSAPALLNEFRNSCPYEDMKMLREALYI